LREIYFESNNSNYSLSPADIVDIAIRPDGVLHLAGAGEKSLQISKLSEHPQPS